MVEFVLISPLLFLLVGGVIQFALALNYWLDLQRIANQGARWAVVARYPIDTPPYAPTCSAANAPCAPDLPAALTAQAQSGGLHPKVSICFPSEGVSSVGEPVRVRLEADFSLIPILGIGTLTLGAQAEMRIEQAPRNVYAATTTDC